MNMMKKLITIILCGVMALSLVACGGGDSAGSSNSDNSGNVGTTNESNDNKNNKKNKKEKAIKKTSETILYGNGVEQSYSYYEYDEKGREVLFTNRTAASGQENTMTTTWEDNGDTAIGTASASGITRTNKYDADGNLLSQETVQDGRVVAVLTYTYKDGVLMESYQESTALASTKMVTEVKYNEYGHPVSIKTSYNDEVQGLTEQDYTYNANGDIETVTTKVTAGEQTSTTTTEYIYDNGVLTGTTSDSGSAEIECDENGNVLEQSTYDANGNLIQKSTYTYY